MPKKQLSTSDRLLLGFAANILALVLWFSLRSAQDLIHRAISNVDYAMWLTLVAWGIGLYLVCGTILLVLFVMGRSSPGAN